MADVMYVTFASGVLQYVVETKYVGERDVAGAATEIVGQERNVVKEQVKPAAAGTDFLNTYRRSVCGACVQNVSLDLKSAHARHQPAWWQA